MATDSINASPTKSFFVDMLTRDIDLKDAILDLLDNCVDGIQRTNREAKPSEMPYEGFWAEITFSETDFAIADNCGGIPLDVAQRYAFRMGKPRNISDDDDIATIGTYGIGMKRAIFKMGQSAQVISQTEEASFAVSIQPDWLTSDSSWDLPLERVDDPLERAGTVVEVEQLRREVASQFATKAFQAALVGDIETLYSYIIAKGFEIVVNGQVVKPKQVSLQWEGLKKLKSQDTEAIAPYLYEGYEQDVNVTVAVGFHRDLPSYEEVDDETAGKKRKSEKAGWTIVCNDRVVLANDKSILTGWGEAGVPKYHPQYIAISGVVTFRSTDARKLPITTTKRGIDTSSELYLHVKERMREGMRLFTTYTSKWKRVPKEEKKRTQRTKTESPTSMFDIVKKVDDEVSAKKGGKSLWTEVKDKKMTVEQRYIPKLPSPPAADQSKRISFNKPTEEIKLIGEYLFDDPDCPPSAVGEACFEEILSQAQEAQ